jgi:hypothetical protein
MIEISCVTGLFKDQQNQKDTLSVESGVGCAH